MNCDCSGRSTITDRHERTRPAKLSTACVEHARGAVVHVDIVRREISVLLPTGSVLFDVPRDCSILLRRERVRLRMVQLGDQVRLNYIKRPNALVVEVLAVDPES